MFNFLPTSVTVFLYNNRSWVLSAVFVLYVQAKTRFLFISVTDIHRLYYSYYMTPDPSSDAFCNLPLVDKTTYSSLHGFL